MAKDCFVLFVEDFGDDFEHLELIMCDLMGFSDEGTTIKQKLPHEHEDVLFEVDLNVGVDVREKRHDGIFDGFDHEWDEFWVFADLANDVPEFVDGDLFLLVRFL